MKISVVFVVVLGLLASTEAGKRFKKCKKDLAAAEEACDAKLGAAAAKCKEERAAAEEACDAKLGDAAAKCKDELNAAGDACDAKLDAAAAKYKEEKDDLAKTIANLQKKLAESSAVFTTKSCGTSNRVVYDEGKYLINTDGGIWVRDGWCRVFDGQEGDNDDSYTVSVDLYADTTEENHLGIAYNVKDMENFDIIYYRPHSTDRCFQSGYVVNGVSTWGVKGACPTQAEFKQWFNAKVVVKPNSNNAEFYLNGEFVTNSQPMKFPKNAKAYVIMANGFANKAHFKNLEIN